MSKQLLHTCGSGAIVVALDDRAFAIVDDARTSSSRAFELTDDGNDADDPASGSTNNSQPQKTENQNKKKKNEREIQAVCCEKIGTKRWFAGRSPMCGGVVARLDFN